MNLPPIGGVLRKPITLVDGRVLPEGTLIIDTRRLMLRRTMIVSYVEGADVRHALSNDAFDGVSDVDWERWPLNG